MQPMSTITFPAANSANVAAGAGRADLRNALFLCFMFALPIWPVYIEAKFEPLPGLVPLRVLRVLLIALCLYYTPGRTTCESPRP